MGEQQEHNIFTSRYQLHLPTVEELESELKRELRFLAPANADSEGSLKPVKKSRKRRDEA